MSPPPVRLHIGISGGMLLNTAREIRWYLTAGLETRSGPGGLLSRALATHGEDALLSLLRPGAERIEVEDGDLSLTLTPGAAGVAVVARYPEGGEVSSFLPFPPAEPVKDLAEALHTPELALSESGGVWHAGEVAGASRRVPALPPESLGSAALRARLGLRLACVAGAMAGGVASVELVEAMGRGGLLGFYGAGGLDLPAVEAAIVRLKAALPAGNFGCNLLHNPAEPEVEERTVDLFLKHGVRIADASAYMQLTPAVVRWRLSGLREEGGRVIADHVLLAKVSRAEVAEQFLRPAPAKIVQELLDAGKITPQQAALAPRLPMADALTGEADSGGHTDRRPLVALIPLLRRLRDRIALEQPGLPPVFIGAAGGLGDPWSVAAAFQLGADYVMTGSVNQAACEAGTSAAARELLAAAAPTDTALCPAPDMFELGAQVQVLSRGTLYAQRASRLHELYRAYTSLDALPAADRDRLERQIFQRPVAQVLEETAAFWKARDPAQWKRAALDPHHQMALCFRWYLGLSSRWARTGEASRKRDYQIWCGPAMGLFNDWVRGTWLEPLESRGVVAIQEALMRGAAVAARVQMARVAGVAVTAEMERVAP